MHVLNSKKKKLQQTKKYKMGVPMMTSSLLLILLMLCWCQCIIEACPSACTCQYNVVWCDNRGLQSIPAGIPQDTTQLYIFDNKISKIKKSQLAGLEVCVFLILVWSNLFYQNKFGFFSAFFVSSQCTLR